MTRLSGDARRDALADLQGWQEVKGRDAIFRSFTFKNFSEAFGFMARVALAAEKMDHHPDWTNAWNRVDVELSTHSEGGVTEKDIKLAKVMDRLGGDA